MQNSARSTGLEIYHCSGLDWGSEDQTWPTSLQVSSESCQHDVSLLPNADATLCKARGWWVGAEHAHRLAELCSSTSLWLKAKVKLYQPLGLYTYKQAASKGKQSSCKKCACLCPGRLDVLPMSLCALSRVDASSSSAECRQNAAELRSGNAGSACSRTVRLC